MHSIQFELDRIEKSWNDLHQIGDYRFNVVVAVIVIAIVVDVVRAMNSIHKGGLNMPGIWWLNKQEGRESMNKSCD